MKASDLFVKCLEEEGQIYLEGEEISVDELRAALREATVNNLVTPVLCGTALRNKGVFVFCAFF